MAVEQVKGLWLRRFGKWFVTPVYSIGTGIMVAVAVSGLSFLAPVTLPLLIPILLGVFLAETWIYIYLLKNDVSNTLVEVFLENPFANLSRPKQILLGLGFFSCLGGGLAIGGLTYMAAIAAMGAILTLFGLSFPPAAIIMIAGFFALVGVVTASALFFKWVSTAIRNDFHKKIVDFFKEIFTRDPKKLLAQQILEGFFKLFFIFAIIAVTTVGTIATLGTMHKDLFAFLAFIPNANLLACQISSGIITYVLAGTSRLPWALRSVCVVFAEIGELIGYAIFRIGYFIANRLDIYHAPIAEPKSTEEMTRAENDETQNNLFDNILPVVNCVVKILAVCIHGISMGALAQRGGGEVLSGIMIELNVPLDPENIVQAGADISLGAGSVMAAALGGAGFSPFFSSPPKQSEVENSPTTKKDIKSNNTLSNVANIAT